MNDPGKSDSRVVPAKLANKAGEPVAEPVEERRLTKGNTGQQNASRTQSRDVGASSALDRVRRVARKDREARVVKTLHVLDYCTDPLYRRAIHRILGRGESRNSLARDIFHGGRGRLRQHYQAGQENQLGALGLMVNVIVLWQTVYIQAALDHLATAGEEIDPADIARLSPLGHPTINVNGRYRSTTGAPSGGLRPLRTPG